MLSKNAKKKLKKKQRKQQQHGEDEKEDEEEESASAALGGVAPAGSTTAKLDVVVEYVEEAVDDPSLGEFAEIFSRFKSLAKPAREETEEPVPERRPKPAVEEGAEEQEEEGEKDDDKPKLSKRKLRLKNRLTVAELKQLVARPEVVEEHDTCAADPRLLVFLKALRNTVPVPRHWCFKRKYLQGKRGIEKPPFVLPEFIRRTGIMEMRQAVQEKEESKTLKAKMREKARPKMGKIDIDYQKLHDAFFRFQTKPKLSFHGDIYYEGKEFETRMRHKKPGDLSDELKTALGMPTGPNAPAVPPPWLLHMQRYGPPPSYPSLKIPGLNAPIPEGATFGYHPGGWGKPPVDEAGRPLYGDVFGTQAAQAHLEDKNLDATIDKKLWGELVEEEEEEESSDDEDEDEDEEGADAGIATPSGITTDTSGLTSMAAGMETPEAVELRKRTVEAAMEDTEVKPLYKVLPQTAASVGSAMMGSQHVYDLKAAVPVALGGAAVSQEGLDISLEDPEELARLDQETLAKKLSEAQQASQPVHEDMSDMVAEHAARQASKRKKADKAQDKSKKFKF